jgi:Rrf2 family protein
MRAIGGSQSEAIERGRDTGETVTVRRRPALTTLESPSALLAITAKSPYALRALAELARAGGDGPMPLGEIARRREVPVQFLEGLFGALRRGGILHSQRGVKGGYSFARPPGEITVLEVVELLEGELGAEARAAGSVWAEAAEALRAVLGGVTVAELAEREAEATAPMYYI